MIDRVLEKKRLFSGAVDLYRQMAGFSPTCVPAINFIMAFWGLIAANFGGPKPVSL